MPWDELPLFEKDPNQSGVREGYTRYIVRTWGTIQYGTFSKIFLNEFGEPELHSSGRHFHDETGDGFEGSGPAEYPGQVSRIYLEPGGFIDPRVLRLRAQPIPHELPRRRPTEFPLDIRSLPPELEPLYRSAAARVLAKRYDTARIESELLLRRFAVMKGAPDDYDTIFYFKFLRDKHLVPPYNGKLVDWFVKVIESNDTGSPQKKEHFAQTLYYFCMSTLWFAYECGGVHKPRWSSFDDAPEPRSPW